MATVAGLVLVFTVAACDLGDADGGWPALGPEGGTVLSLALDPRDPGTVYAGTFGGVFKRTDGGADPPHVDARDAGRAHSA